MSTPTVVGGTFCGPAPGPGNGRGEDGVCTGAEAAPPCGAGVEPGRRYEYTLPLRCDGVVVFDGRRWLSLLPPATNGGTMHVWMALAPSGDRAGFIGPTGSVGFLPVTDQAPVSGPCRGG